MVSDYVGWASIQTFKFPLSAIFRMSSEPQNAPLGT